jgi:hypothetical protein
MATLHPSFATKALRAGLDQWRLARVSLSQQANKTTSRNGRPPGVKPTLSDAWVRGAARRRLGAATGPDRGRLGASHLTARTTMQHGDELFASLSRESRSLLPLLGFWRRDRGCSQQRDFPPLLGLR